MKKTIYTVAKIITGIVFTFSGLVKATDPVGTQIKLGDYFDALGLSSLSPYAMFFAFILNAAELITGLMLLTNTFTKLATWTGLLFMLIFTPLTLWLAITNSVTDCGCFGDAVKLTNWQTFYKNIILLLLVIIIFIYRKKYGTNFSAKKTKIIFSAFILFAFLFQFYNLYNLPVADFRPFKEGTNIKQAITIPENAEKDVYETVLYYKNLKTGEKKAFDINNIPYEDTLNWEYDTTITKLVKKGYEPPIHDFFLSTLTGQDITEKILDYKNLTLFLIMPDFEKGIKNIKSKKTQIEEIAKYAKENRYPFYCLTSSPVSTIKQHKISLPEYIQTLTADGKMLKTFIRSNPGFVIMKNAVIIKKYHYLNLPEISEIKKLNNPYHEN